MMRYVMMMVFLFCSLVLVAEPIHEGTGPRTDAGSNINNLSGIVYAPAFDKFLGIRQNNTVYVYDPATMAAGEEKRVPIGGCAGGDKESIAMVDPWGLTAYADSVFVMDEDTHTLCEYSVEGIVNAIAMQYPLQTWDLDTIIPITYNSSEGLVFIPGDPDCPDTARGGCFVVNQNQGARTLHKVRLTPVLEAVGSTFTVDAPCGWFGASGGSLQDMNYDWANERVYVLNPSVAYSHSCVLDKTMTQYIDVSPFPLQWKFEGFAWGHGYVVWSNDNDAGTGQMISFQLDAYTAVEPLCLVDDDCGPCFNCEFQQCSTENICSGSLLNLQKQASHGEYAHIEEN